MYRINNFNPGPAALPLEVLHQAQDKFIAYRNGMSIMEMSHRSRDVEQLFEETQQIMLEILGLDSQYQVLFMSGGASMQFAMVPLNFMSAKRNGSYVLSGSFSEKAYKEAQTVGNAKIVASSKPQNWCSLPAVNDLRVDPEAAYLHFTTNNTIEGSQFHDFPSAGSVPLIGDMTSDLLSRKMAFNEFSMLYASAQKNLGPAGATVVVIRDDLLKACVNPIPTILNYKTYAQNNSLYNTPPVHSIYMMKLVLEWVKRQGGITEIEKVNVQKANLLYDVIDSSGGYYKGFIEKPFRSMMNITWRMRDEELEKLFVQESELHGFDGLAGHRSVGGLRASAYNAVPIQACKDLAEFMIDFQKRKG
ncbi:3-phosphoserine/phosphohydroxythreonine transaminase [Paenibacillus qinlingensis]|uniref:3-phosphoserine/phosphohydroxythreonine transaminase n=1 Tax=Paenibacillus qinlingensis TaxID=1837343 RepID=UPI0015654AC1|nr:3-phosphoserine/phosphohydroxythreonine transaminase [Paenibacillus qinlingensis]NQX60482.1 3-phosphoserine/phosphohydroxythreonine transaminase [Paenibacillus qinlingensis]